MARRSPVAGPGRRSKCAPSALAASSLGRRASRDQCLQRAGRCVRARGACARAPVGCVLTKVCLLNPLLGCPCHPECEHPGLKPCLIGEAAGVTRASSSSPAPRRDEGAQGRGCHGQLGTPVAQLRGRFRALCWFADTLAGSVPSPATGTERTLSSEEPRALPPHGAAERALSPSPPGSAKVKWKTAAERILLPLPRRRCNPGLGLGGWGGVPPG